MSWVDIRNWELLFRGFQLNNGDKHPGLDPYLQKIIEQNEQILKELKDLNCSAKGIYL